MLGGTLEATRLCRALAGAGLRGTVSMAGRVARPADQALPLRIGGFGGAEGLATYLRAQRITHVIDATHPFAAQMSANAVAACRAVDVPLIALTRAPWGETADDHWTRVPGMAGAVAALGGAPRRVMLAVGRMHLPDFAVQPQHFYLLRLVDPPEARLDFPDHHVVVDRGPFGLEGDLALLRDHAIDLVVSKNSGGTGAFAKIAAARELGLPVIMIDRPSIPARHETHEVEEVLRWLDHAGTDLGV
ncbi:precorrin-6A reductase [Alloyangia pacifica]|uniref:Precorrin-6A reductase n=1 Tax=Alloyangia pacifica TaxID=311180 RepID=A0A1I6VS20_9RHOB|nr:precorrin-6A reductase [Alloyangia pacifica]SFT16532.1 precorrin-6A reductase [Alloyangia pacifica]